MSTGILDFFKIESKSDWIEMITDFLRNNCISYAIISDHIKFEFFFLNFDIYHDQENYIIKLEKNSSIPYYMNNLLFGIYSNKDKVDFKIGSPNNLLIFVRNMIEILRIIRNIYSKEE